MRNKKGFTLMELLIVVGIIGILIAMALPRVQIAMRSARSNADLANIRIINTQLELYNVITGKYPVAPILTEMLTSTTYFPDGYPKCPFLNTNALGTYSITAAEVAAAGMRVTTRVHWTSITGHEDFIIP